MEGIEIEVPDREEAACALDTVEARLVRQGQYDAACDVINAKRRIRLDEEEIAALESQLAQYRWRRVEDGMPDGPRGIDVLVWNGDAQFVAYTMLCGDGKVRWVDASSQDYEASITHWMPLPVAPEEGV